MCQINLTVYYRSIHLCVRAMTFYMLMIDVNSLVADYVTNRLLKLLGHYVCFQKKEKRKKKVKINKKIKKLVIIENKKTQKKR